MSAERLDSRRTRPAPPNSAGFRADIQGLRAVAVVAVLLYHAGLPFMPGGFIGVDVFFVISGFLITGHLLSSLGLTAGGSGSGRVDLASFYARRARRILPAAIVVTVMTVIAAVIVVPPLRLESILRDAVFSALFVPNLHFAAERTDYLAGSEPSPFQHFWSLGVEEQFYLVWPLLLIALVAIARRARTRNASAADRVHDSSAGASDTRLRILVLLVAVTAASFVLCIAVSQLSAPWAFFGTPMRAWELTLGSIVACLATIEIPMSATTRSVGGWVGLTAIVASAMLFTHDTAHPGAMTLVPVAGAAAVLWCGVQPTRTGPARLLGIRPLQFFGLVSYSLYLVHWPVIVLAQEAVGAANALPLWATVALAALAVPLAWVVHRVVERPMLERKIRDRHHGRRTLATMGVATLALVGSLIGGTMAIAAAPLHSERAATSAPLTPRPAGTPFVPSNLTPSLTTATVDAGDSYRDGCQQKVMRAAILSCEYGDTDSDFTIALFGDSHAGHWFPALEQVATQREVKLVTFTKSRCRSEESDALWATTDEPSCAVWRADALVQLAEDPPDLIVLTNHIGPLPDRDQTILEDRWRAVTTESIARLPQASAVVIIADTPEFAASPVDCLSGNLEAAGRCAVERDAAVNGAVMAAQQTVTSAAGAGFIDLTDYLCGRESCPAIIGDTLVYSDDHHLTAAISEQLTRPLDARLAPFLP